MEIEEQWLSFEDVDLEWALGSLMIVSRVYTHVKSN